MLQKSKTDAELGYNIEQYLISKGVNTPTIADALDIKDEIKKSYIRSSRRGAVVNESD